MTYDQAKRLTVIPRPLTMDEASRLAKLWQEEVDKSQDRIRLQEAVIEYVNAHADYLDCVNQKPTGVRAAAYVRAKEELWALAKEINSGQMRGSHPRLLGALRGVNTGSTDPTT